MLLEIVACIYIAEKMHQFCKYIYDLYSCRVVEVDVERGHLLGPRYTDYDTSYRQY